MPTPAVNLLQALADTLKVAVEDLDDAWGRIARDAEAAARAEVRGRLLARGCTAAQADGWDRLAEYARDIGLYFALVRGAGLHGYEDKWVARLDRRGELDASVVRSAGARPPSAALCGSGRY